MAERPTEFSYHNIELYKSESLGSGSYGGVYKAKCDGLLCAAKIMHPTLFDLRDPGTASYLRKFREECHLLSLARHPNVVQYLGTYTDPDTRLPVLLMELCDESLTAFLERSPGPLSYHTQVNMAHDIALALVYLHSNGLIHRDLTGNNVLMIAGIRAKITDFGMSKLATVNPRMTALTLCPGNVLYMSPEALDEAKSYTSKLDVFSFGVIVVQILTRQFPNPTDRFRLVSVPQFKEQVRVLVPDAERRQAHLRLIANSHALKPLALQCLKKMENERPSAHQLSERLSELKQSSGFTESREQAEHSSEIEQLQLQLQGQRILTNTTVARNREQITGLENVIRERDREIQDKDRQLQQKHQAMEVAIASRDQELQASEQLVSEFQQSLQLKDKTITDLQRTISDHERKIQQLKQGDRARGDQQPASAPQTAVAVDLSKKKWSEGNNAPE
ncbi:Dual specificity protein kinase shkC, partial [Geodia barretti]